MEHDSQPSTKPSIDILSTLNHHDVVRIIETANDQLWQHVNDVEITENLIDEYDSKIRTAIGEEYFDREAIATGLVYTTDHRGNLTSSRLYLDQKKIVFYGPAVMSVEGTPEIVFEFYDHDIGASDEITISAQSTYYMLPEDITRLELLPLSTLIDEMDRRSTHAKEITTRPDFYLLEAHEQHELLKAIAENFNEGMRASISLPYAVKTMGFMAEYDNMPLLLEDTWSDQTQLPADIRFIPDGIFKGIRYAESISDPQRCIESPDDYMFSGGAPCMQLRNDINHVTFLIPIDGIEAIEPLEEYK